MRNPARTDLRGHRVFDAHHSPSCADGILAFPGPNAVSVPRISPVRYGCQFVITLIVGTSTSAKAFTRKRPSGCGVVCKDYSLAFPHKPSFRNSKRLQKLGLYLRGPALE